MGYQIWELKGMRFAEMGMGVYGMGMRCGCIRLVYILLGYQVEGIEVLALNETYGLGNGVWDLEM